MDCLLAFTHPGEGANPGFSRFPRPHPTGTGVMGLARREGLPPAQQVRGLSLPLLSWADLEVRWTRVGVSPQGPCQVPERAEADRSPGAGSTHTISSRPAGTGCPFPPGGHGASEGPGCLPSTLEAEPFCLGDTGPSHTVS